MSTTHSQLISKNKSQERNPEEIALCQRETQDKKTARRRCWAASRLIRKRSSAKSRRANYGFYDGIGWEGDASFVPEHYNRKKDSVGYRLFVSRIDSFSGSICVNSLQSCCLKRKPVAPPKVRFWLGQMCIQKRTLSNTDFLRCRKMPENVGKTVSCIFFDFWLVAWMIAALLLFLIDLEFGIESMLCAGGEFYAWMLLGLPQHGNS